MSQSVVCNDAARCSGNVRAGRTILQTVMTVSSIIMTACSHGERSAVPVPSVSHVVGASHAAVRVGVLHDPAGGYDPAAVRDVLFTRSGMAVLTDPSASMLVWFDSTARVRHRVRVRGADDSTRAYIARIVRLGGDTIAAYEGKRHEVDYFVAGVPAAGSTTLAHWDRARADSVNWTPLGRFADGRWVMVQQLLTPFRGIPRDGDVYAVTDTPRVIVGDPSDRVPRAIIALPPTQRLFVTQRATVHHLMHPGGAVSLVTACDSGIVVVTRDDLVTYDMTGRETSRVPTLGARRHWATPFERRGAANGTRIGVQHPLPDSAQRVLRAWASTVDSVYQLGSVDQDARISYPSREPMSDTRHVYALNGSSLVTVSGAPNAVNGAASLFAAMANDVANLMSPALYRATIPAATTTGGMGQCQGRLRY